MPKDCRELEMTAASAEAVVAHDRVIDAYIGYRSDIPARMEALFAADPHCPMAHILKGYFTLQSYKRAFWPAAIQANEAAEKLIADATPREKVHQKALSAWLDAGAEAASPIWAEIMRAYPRDVLAFRLHHFVNFWAGRPDAMLRGVLQVERHWDDDTPGFNAVLGCRCFAMEETGRYTEAEAAGRAAIQRDPTDLWSAHGVAHVLEMTGRRSEGTAWIDALQNNWSEANNLRHHLWWHKAMYLLEQGHFFEVLRLYDTRFRDLASPLVQAVPDLYIDVQNAASMLFRLARHGVDPGDRWVELADKAEARIGDCENPFTLPHWMMALAATGRDGMASRMLAGMRDYARGNSINAGLVRELALPVTQAVLAHGLGQHAQAVALMRPVLGEMYRLGGSHAQQDVLEQLFLDAALKAELDADARMVIERVSGRHPVPPSRRMGYAMAL